jgi:hypothetical protein
MLNFLKIVLSLGGLFAVHAVPIHFIDAVEGSKTILIQGQTYNFTHNINDNGFNSSTDAITSADIYIILFDDADKATEKVKITFDNLTIEDKMKVNYMAYHFAAASSLLQSDGLLNVSLKVVAGDFYCLGSWLEVEADRSTPAAVPEPTSWAMMGLGLIALGVFARRRRIE